MPKKKLFKSKELYYKGNRLNKFFKETVIQTARIKKQNVSTPTRLKKFYEDNKDKFGKLFEIGLETQLTGTSTIFNQFDKAEENNNEFFIEQEGKVKPITAKNAKFQLAKLEQQLNVLLGSTGVEYSYKKKLDNSITLSLPTEEEIEEIQDEPIEFINDYLSDYGIKIYTSDERKRKKFKANADKRKAYSERVERKFKEFRKEFNREKRKAAKSKAKRKKR